MADESGDKALILLKRKRRTVRANITKFSNDIIRTASDVEADNEYNRMRLQETLDQLVMLDNDIHELLPDAEYDADVIECEKYVEVAKRAIFNSTRAARDELSETARPSVAAAEPSLFSIPHSVKLPTIKIEPFAGDIERWSRFWEQFQSAVDNNPTINTIDKHVFLRGYLEGEPKELIDGIAVTADAYQEVKKILIGRYGDKNRIIQAHLDYLENMKPVFDATPEALNCTYIECNRRIQALRALGENVDHYGRMLAPKLLRAFPDDICRRWIIYAKREKISEAHITRLMEFLNEEVEGALTAQKIKGNYAVSNLHYPTAAALQVTTRKSQTPKKTKTSPFCVYCEEKNHWAQNCTKMTDVKQRIEKLKSTQRCFLCLNRSHTVRNCSKKNKVSCTKCKGPHHVSICEGQVGVTVGKIEVIMPHLTYLQTARIWVIGPTGLRKRTRCILDVGSQSSFISSDLIDDLKLKVTDQRNLSVTAFEAPLNKSVKRRVANFTIRGVWTKDSVQISAFESSNTYSPHPAVPHDIQSLSRLHKLQLADPQDDVDDLTIEVLIGGDQYWQVMKDEHPIRISNSMVLLPSRFGWILSGNKSGTTVNHVSVNHVSTNAELLSLEDNLRRFWDLETIGIKEDQRRAFTTRESAILEDFHESFKMEDGRRVVSLPRKEGVILHSNYKNAERRFYSLKNKFNGNKQFREVYYSLMTDYFAKGHVEMVPETEPATDTFYMPHHAVKKQKDGNTKWRIVFDASSHEKGSISLNDALEAGPNLLPEILATLLRFRLYRLALIGDGTQAFLQLCLDRNDRDLTRFLWFGMERQENGEWKTTDSKTEYRFTRLPFGLTCSPFLLSATLRELVSMFGDKYPLATKLLDQGTFMDDFTASLEEDNEIITVYYEITGLFREIKMPMSKWATNSTPLKDIWIAEGREEKRCTRVLGVNWNTHTDSFLFDPQDVVGALLEEPATKRQVLQATARFYDPLGLLSPISITGKILFQDTWCRGLAWDDLLPLDLARRWQIWTSSLIHLSDIQIPRWIGASTRTPDNYQVHVFCDASERAYGAVLYIRVVESDTISVHLICSKNRLSPIKRVTLPRLELLSALLGIRLLKYFCQSTGYDNMRTTLWSDSMVALGWIHSNPNRWKPFVSNRVTEIQQSSNPAQWRHCPGEDNPADILSRGMSAKELQSSQWWHAPRWLSNAPNFWPQHSISTTPLPEGRKNDQVLTVSTWECPIDANRFSSYWKMIRVMGWILRFIKNVRSTEKHDSELTATELETAKLRWIYIAQLESFGAEHTYLREKKNLPFKSKIARYNPFLKDNLIRLGGRLDHADLTPQEKHPLLLDGSHHFTKLLIKQTHINLQHLGVRIVLSELRQQYWILKARQSIKKVIHTCLPCKITKNLRGDEIEAPLPVDRLKFTKPFTVTGVDFAGPLYVRVGSVLQKSYIVLFTCAITRALHLELASDMSTEKFIMSFRRFSSRHGLPHTIYSDNARTFQAASRELAELSQIFADPRTSQHFAHNGVSWKFIVPRAAWWGGWWERMVGTTKRCLRKVLGTSQVDEENLRTILAEIEAAINSRPIIQDGPDVLTPSHFINGGRLTTLPPGPEPNINTDLRKVARVRAKLQEDFWKRWKKEYLLALRSFHEVRQPDGRSTKCRNGDVVLLQDDMRPRHLWRRARISAVRPGRDGRARTLVLRLSDGTEIIRPVQLVVPLEIDQGGEDVAD